MFGLLRGIFLMPDGYDFASHGATGEICAVFGPVFAAWYPTAGAWLNIGDGGDVLYGTGFGYHQVFLVGARNFVFTNLFMSADVVIVLDGLTGFGEITVESFKVRKIPVLPVHVPHERPLMTRCDASHLPCTPYTPLVTRTSHVSRRFQAT